MEEIDKQPRALLPLCPRRFAREVDHPGAMQEPVEDRRRRAK